MEHVREVCDKAIFFCAVGNKIDATESRQVFTEDARSAFEGMNPAIPYMEVSAETGENVRELFDYIVRGYRQRKRSN